MAGDGRVSQLNVIDLADPHNPRLERTVALAPARPDFVADGVYDVHVAGGKAFATVHYSDQEDAPAQSVVEIIDLGARSTTRARRSDDAGGHAPRRAAAATSPRAA